MLILILIYAQHLQNVVPCFEKGWNAQNQSSSDSHHQMKNLLQLNFTLSPTIKATSVRV